MSDIIHLLPDSIANQIAAGEVVQRPASAVKELLENAVDSGASKIDLFIKDGGKTLIKVIDNGCGMSYLDARMCFERHATSKIKTTLDLFNIRTKGFRGEAMSSIAAIAQVELKTRRDKDELGTEIEIAGSDVRYHRTCTCPVGTMVSIRNLFFNVPARRNFLKSTSSEAKHVIGEFIRVALAHPEISFRMEHQDALIYDLPRTDVLNRILQVFGNDAEDDLLKVEEHTPYLTIKGYIGKPEAARKVRGDQYFFVNDRFVKDGYLHHALLNAYQDTLQKDEIPMYVLYLSIAPKHIDINIHPTKTEVKFDDQSGVYTLLKSAVRKALGMFHMSPEENNLSFSGPGLREHSGGQEATISDFNRQQPSRMSPDSWQALFNTPTQGQGVYKDIHQGQMPLFQPGESLPTLVPDVAIKEFTLWLWEQKMIIMPIPAGLMFIDPQAAHQCVLYDRFLNATGSLSLASQQLLYPQNLVFSAMETERLRECEPFIRTAGFDLREFGKNVWLLSGLPAEISHQDAKDILDTFLAEPEGGRTPVEQLREKLARSVAKKTHLPQDCMINLTAARHLVSQWKKSQNHTTTPDGKPVFWILSMDEMEKRFR